ncbi:Hypothetical predicted protein [Octopus vulgaris]|uniref:Uncharacterized protein n=1 Tax=Octopus vulgaris TaxID=6645 RepID=A0AA36BPJ3_OCTVU|nr:Hypothetical predicted protein [Octopus vulgaris]
MSPKHLTYGRILTDSSEQPNDIDSTELFEEILDCRMLLSGREHLQISNPEELLQFIVQYGDESVFPNIRVAIQILLTVAVSIAGCEILRHAKPDHILPESFYDTRKTPRPRIAEHRAKTSAEHQF